MAAAQIPHSAWLHRTRFPTWPHLPCPRGGEPGRQCAVDSPNIQELLWKWEGDGTPTRARGRANRHVWVWAFDPQTSPTPTEVWEPDPRSCRAAFVSFRSSNNARAAGDPSTRRRLPVSSCSAQSSAVPALSLCPREDRIRGCLVVSGCPRGRLKLLQASLSCWGNRPGPCPSPCSALGSWRLRGSYMHNNLSASLRAEG